MSAAAVLGAGCHSNNQDSGYGLAFVTLTDSPGDFAAYVVNVDSVSMTGEANGLITAVGAVETVDLTKLKDISELWSNASIPDDTYTSITITLDYTNANVAVIRDGAPVKAKVVDTTATAVTTYTVTINLDKDHYLTVVPTYATTSAQRLALNFDLAASNEVYLSTATPEVVVKPFITAATSASDMKPVRVRGPLINSSINVGTYTVYVRPFFDEVNSLGSLSMFTDANTTFLINGTYYKGSAAGIGQLSGSSAGTTVTAAYTTYEPTPDVAQATSAAKFNATYVVAGSTLEDFYTQGLEGDVVARNGNTLTVRGATVQFNDGTSTYYEADSLVLLGTSTIVTADNDANITGLNYKSVSVGQHIIARGLYSEAATGVITLDATGNSSTNTGSVRIVSTELFGSVLSAGGGTLDVDVSSFRYWPSDIFNQAGTGTPPATASDYSIATGSLALPAGIGAGSRVWVDGFVRPFGSAPPDFEAVSINSEISVPARLQVDWPEGTAKPFLSASPERLIVNLANNQITNAVIRIGEESIDMKSLAASPAITAQAGLAPTSAGVPSAFLPLFSVGSLTAADTTTIDCFNSLEEFIIEESGHVTASTPAYHLTANGYYNRGTNTFVASSIDLVN